MSTIELPGLARYRFSFTAIDPLSLPQYTGSAWRGLLGHGLRRSACAIAADHCNACLLQSGCAYFQVFETQQAGDPRAGRARQRPHPFVLSVTAQRRHLAAGDPLDLTIHLFGAAIGRLPFIVQALVEAGKLGIGSPRGRFLLSAVSQEQHLGENDWQPIYNGARTLSPLPSVPPTPPPAPDAIDIELLTPLRSKRNGHFLGPREFRAGDLLRQLWRRVNELAGAYGGDAGDDPGGLTLTAPRSRADCFDADTEVDLHWRDWSRYSSRQHARMHMGGVVGTLRLRGDRDDLAQWWPLLWLGQWLHLGKATSMGLGHYRLRPAQTCEPDATPNSGAS